MSNSSKKRSGIGGFWDSVAPPADELQPEPTTPDIAQTVQPVSVDEERPQPLARSTETTRPRGRPPSSVPKERMTINLSSRSIEILESLRYQKRMGGQRNATFSDLLDEALDLLAKHYQLSDSD
jgi:hypothetical protein